MSRVAFVAAMLLVVPACERKGGAPRGDEPDHPAATAHAASAGHEKSDDHGHEELPRKLAVTKQVIENAGIKTARVRKEVLSEALTLPGEIAADPDRLARISSPAAGRIEQVHFREGAVVKKGQALVVVRVPELARVRSSHDSALAKAKAARANAERLRGLLAQRLAAEQAVLDAEAEAQALEVEANSLGQQLGALGAGASGAFSVTLRSPIAGSVVARDAVVGQAAVADQALGTVANLEEVWFLARVFEKDLGKLSTGAKAEVHLNAYPGEHFEGSVEYVGQQIDSVARTVTARIRLRNSDGKLRLGLFGTSQVSTGNAEKAEQRARAHLLCAAARGARHGPHRGSANGRCTEAPPSSDDGARGFVRVSAHGGLDGSWQRGTATACHRGDRGFDHGDAAHDARDSRRVRISGPRERPARTCAVR